MDIHCIADNYATHDKQEVQDWIYPDSLKICILPLPTGAEAILLPP